MLLFPLQKGVVVPLNDSISIVSSNGSSILVHSLIRISLQETLDHYLENEDLHRALMLIDKEKISPYKITEYNLKKG